MEGEDQEGEVITTGSVGRPSLKISSLIDDARTRSRSQAECKRGWMGGTDRSRPVTFSNGLPIRKLEALVDRLRWGVLELCREHSSSTPCRDEETRVEINESLFSLVARSNLELRHDSRRSHYYRYLTRESLIVTSSRFFHAAVLCEKREVHVRHLARGAGWHAKLPSPSCFL